MNFAYWSSWVFTDSSTRAWTVTDFGCLGGALMIAMLSFCSSFMVLSYILSYIVSDSLLLRGQNTSCKFQQQEAGVTPEARRDRAAILRRGGVAPGLLSVLPACILAVLLLASPYSSGVSRCSWVTSNLKAELKVGWSPFFTGVVSFCGLGIVGLGSKRAV